MLTQHHLTAYCLQYVSVSWVVSSQIKRIELLPVEIYINSHKLGTS